PSVVSKLLRAGYNPQLRLKCISPDEYDSASTFRQGPPRFLCPLLCGAFLNARCAVGLDQEFCVLSIGKKFKLEDSLCHLSCAPLFPEHSHGAINQWRTDGKFLHRQQLVRSKLVVPQSKLRRSLDLDAATIAIIPRGRRMDF